MLILPFQCPRCKTEFEPPVDAWSVVCPKCGKTIDLQGQFAYSRGASAFEEALDAASDLEHMKRTRKGPMLRFEYADREREMLNLFGQAYTALLEGFQFELPEEQHEHSVEMMIHIARLFLGRNMVSTVEASYWNSLMVYYTAFNERLAVQEKLKKQGMPALLFRWRWRMRDQQLDKALENLDRRLRAMEASIHFAHPVRAYRRRHS